jgi:sec-independent protein translocase protein TatA
MGELSPWHLLILAAVFVILFGSRKLPDAARSIGRSMRILRAETSKGAHEDDEADQEHSAVQQAPAQQAPQQLQASQQPQPQPQQQQPVGDGTLVSGAPLSQAQRDQQSS